MLPKSTTEKAKKLLKEGLLSKRAIAKTLGISRVTLNKIEQKMLFPEGKPQEPKIKIVHFHEGDDKLNFEARPTYARCKGCGGMQQDHVACLVCATRKKMAEQKKELRAYDDFMDELLGYKEFNPSPLSGRDVSPTTIPYPGKSAISKGTKPKKAQERAKA